MDTLDVVFGNSCYSTLKNSQLNSNILMFNVKFNVGDLSNIEKFNIKIPEELYYEKNNVNFKEEYDIIIKNIVNKNKIRVWTGRKDIYSYLIMLYISSVVKKYKYDLYVLYCDEYDENYPSPSVMNEKELRLLSKLEHKLSVKEINDNVKIWNDLINENTDLRVIDNNDIKSVSFDFYDNFILDNLKIMGKVRISSLVGKLMQQVYLHDNMWAYLIEGLIKKHKIKINIDNNIRYFDNYVEFIND